MESGSQFVIRMRKIILKVKSNTGIRMLQFAVRFLDLCLGESMNNKDENEISAVRIKLKSLTSKRDDIIIRLKRIEMLQQETELRNQVVEEQYQMELNDINNQIAIVEAKLEKETLKQKQQIEDTFEKDRQTHQELENKRREDRVKSIKSFCTECGIKRLVHFTRIDNLKSILHHRLLGRRSLERLFSTDKPIFNDAHRFDGHPEAICLSISFPNYRMFHKYKSKNEKEWVVLVLEPCILWEFECAFFEENAASNSAKNVALLHRKECSSLARMFMDSPPYNRQDLGIPNNYTTNPQAEVLVLESIAPKYISEIHFCDKSVMEKWLDENKGDYSQRFIFNRDYFRPRLDYEKWQSSNTNIPQQEVDED
jgi:hypothetical protein